MSIFTILGKPYVGDTQRLLAYYMRFEHSAGVE
jgi:hypothetical protein